MSAAQPNAGGAPPAADRTEGGSNRRGNNNNNQQSQGQKGPKAANPDSSMAGHKFHVSSQGSKTGDKVAYVKALQQLKGIIGKEYKEFTAELLTALETLALADPAEPALPVDQNNLAQVEIWKELRKDRSKRLLVYAGFRVYTYQLVWNHCTVSLQDKISGMQGFQGARSNGIELLRIVRRAVFAFDDGVKNIETFWEVLQDLINLERGGKTLAQYNEQFDALVKVLEAEQWSIIPAGLLEQVATANGRAGAPNDNDREEARQRILAVLFVKNSAKGTGGGKSHQYHEHLKRAFIDGDDNYPPTVAEAHARVQHHETQLGQSNPNTPRRGNRGDRGRGRRSEDGRNGSGVAFATVSLFSSWSTTDVS